MSHLCVGFVRNQPFTIDWSPFVTTRKTESAMPKSELTRYIRFVASWRFVDAGAGLSRWFKREFEG
jgi:hypothetical protein